ETKYRSGEMPLRYPQSHPCPKFLAFCQITRSVVTVGELSSRNRICRKFIPLRHCPHHGNDPTDNCPAKNQIDIEYSPETFHVQPPRQRGWHEIKNSAYNQQDPFDDFHKIG